MKIKSLIKTLFLWCAAAFIIAGLGCGRLSLTGGGTEDVNAKTIAGLIVTSNGAPASETAVLLFTSHYNPVTDSLLLNTYLDTTDKKGAYRFSKLDTGFYTLQAVQNQDRTRLLIENIHVSKDSATSAPTGALQKPGAFKIMLPDSVDPATGYVYIPGTAIKSFIQNTSGFVELDSVPPGKIRALYYGARGITPYSIRDTIQVLSGDSATLSTGPWAHSIKMYLNTTASGANIAGNVYDFPVLVRLTKLNFDFSQAKGKGEDVRCIKTGGAFLPYEIEGWDSAQGKAALWVNVDTIKAGADQYITMCWGNPVAKAVSSGPSVFDTAKGFAAVWHFNNDCNDATGNNYRGTNYGTVDTEGLIGAAKKFSGGDSIRIAGLLGSPGTVSLSAWAQLDSNAGSGGEILSIGDAASFRIDDTRPNFGVEGCFHSSSKNVDSTFSNAPSGVTLGKTGWHYVVVTFNGATLQQSLFIDGKNLNQSLAVTPINYSGVGTNTLIGKHGNGKNNFNFIGKVDEARVSKNILSADWILLCYMNQKEKDAVVSFQP
jgi:hypothetical protein